MLSRMKPPGLIVRQSAYPHYLRHLSGRWRASERRSHESCRPFRARNARWVPKSPRIPNRPEKIIRLFARAGHLSCARHRRDVAPVRSQGL